MKCNCGRNATQVWVDQDVYHDSNYDGFWLLCDICANSFFVDFVHTYIPTQSSMPRIHAMSPIFEEIFSSKNWRELFIKWMDDHYFSVVTEHQSFEYSG